MKLNELYEGNIIKSGEGEIDSQTLDNIIARAMRQFETDIHIDKIRRLVIDGYTNKDISKVDVNGVIKVLKSGGHI